MTDTPDTTNEVSVRPSFKRAKSKPEPEAKTEAPKEEAVAAPEPTKPTESVKEQIGLPSRLEEVASMIEIKNYVSGLINGNFTLDKAKMKELQGINLLLNIKIVDMILSPEFKSFVNFKDAEKVNKAAAWNNNVKASLYR
jgi:DNA polymerase III alpha subunit (gram-positive type)